jgi:hypothetical protein
MATVVAIFVVYRPSDIPTIAAPIMIALAIFSLAELSPFNLPIAVRDSQ